MGDIDISELFELLGLSKGPNVFTMTWPELYQYTGKLHSIENLSEDHRNQLIETASLNMDIVKSIFRYFAKQLIVSQTGVGEIVDPLSFVRTLSLFSRIFCVEQVQGFSDEKRALFVADGLAAARREVVSKIEEGGLSLGIYMVRNQLNIGDICVEICDKWFAAAH